MQQLSAKGRKKVFMRRNSFIEMAKLHNLSGRIIYISSHAKQEYLYEVYATEPERAFWRELFYGDGDRVVIIYGGAEFSGF